MPITPLTKRQKYTDNKGESDWEILLPNEDWIFAELCSVERDKPDDLQALGQGKQHNWCPSAKDGVIHSYEKDEHLHRQRSTSVRICERQPPDQRQDGESQRDFDQGTRAVVAYHSRQRRGCLELRGGIW